VATDATGAPTSLGIRKYNTSADAPSGLGFNGAMDDIDALLVARVTKPASIASGEAPVWNGSAFVRSSVTNVGPTSLGSGTPDSTKFLRGDGSWQVPPATSGEWVSASKTSGLLTTTGVAIVVPFDSEDFKSTAGLHSNVTNNSRLTVVTAGKYVVTATVLWDTNATGFRFANIKKNGTTDYAYTVIAAAPVSSTYTGHQVVTLMDLATSDYVELFVQQNSGGNLNVFGGSAGTRLAMHKVG
jgi:hypothetical protein